MSDRIVAKSEYDEIAFKLKSVLNQIKVFGELNEIENSDINNIIGKMDMVSDILNRPIIERKYELTSITEVIKLDFGEDIILHHIRALVDIPEYGVKKGDLGGALKGEGNLSHYGLSWVGENAWVLGNARVSDNALVTGNAMIFDNASINGNSRVYDNARVFGNAVITGNARVHGSSSVYGDILVYDNAEVSEHAKVFGRGHVNGNMIMTGNQLLVSCLFDNNTPEYSGIVASTDIC